MMPTLKLRFVIIADVFYPRKSSKKLSSASLNHYALIFDVTIFTVTIRYHRIIILSVRDVCVRYCYKDSQKDLKHSSDNN